MAILVDKNTKVITQGITGKTGQFHTRMCRDYANGRNCFVAGVNPKKAGEDFEGIPIYGTVKEAKEATGATVSAFSIARRTAVATGLSPGTACSSMLDGITSNSYPACSSK